LINNGTDINRFLSNKERIIAQAYKDNAQKCIELLLKNNVNLWITNGIQEKFPIANSIVSNMRYEKLSENEKSQKFETLLDYMKKQKDNCESHEDFLARNKYFLYSFDKKFQFDSYINKFSDLVTEIEMNNILLNLGSTLIKVNKNLLLDIIPKCDETEVKKVISEHIYHVDLLTLILLKKPMNLDDVYIENKNQHIKPYVKELIEEVKKDMIRCSTGFIVIIVDQNGNRTSQLDVYKKNFADLMRLQSAINTSESSKRKNKP